MDFIDKFPVEISHYIFAYLPACDLLNCFRVSRRWREIVNSNHLWKRHCLLYATKEEIERAESKIHRCNFSAVVKKDIYFLRKRTTSSSNKLGEDCGCIQLYRKKLQKFIRSWKTGNCRIFHMSHSEGHLYEIITCSQSSSLCFFAYHPPRLGIAEVERNRINNLYFVNVPLPRWGRFETVAMSSLYLAVSSRNMVLVLKKMSGRYTLWKAFAYFNDNVTLSAFVTFHCSDYQYEHVLSVTLLTNEYLWLRTRRKMFNIHLMSGLIRDFLADYSWTVNIESNVALKQKKLKIYSVSGNLLCSRFIRSHIKALLFNDLYVVCSRLKKRQYYLEVWEPKTNVKKLLKRLEYNTQLAIYKNFVFLLECKWECYHRVSCIHIPTGVVKWVHIVTSQGIRMGYLLIRTVFQVVCDRFLIVHYPMLNENKYTVLDIFSGHCLYERDVGQGKLFFANPKFIIISRQNELEIMNYL